MTLPTPNQSLTPLSQDAGDHFGASVAFDDDIGVVGTQRNVSGGNVWFFALNRATATWTTLDGISVGGSTGGGGSACAKCGTDVAVGAPTEVVGGTSKGAALFGTYSGVGTWNPTVWFYGTQTGELLGSALAIGPNVAVVGCPGRDAFAGRLKVVNRSPGGTTWVHDSYLTLTAPQAGDYFGQSVCIRGDWTLAAGAPFRAGGGSVGRFIYNPIGGTWDLAEEVSHAQGVQFGTSVALSQDGLWMAVGDPAYPNPLSAGRVYLYNLSSGTATLFDTINGENAGDEFGTTVTFDPPFLLIGAPNFVGPGANTGAVYYYLNLLGVYTKLFTATQSLTGLSTVQGLGSSLASSGSVVLAGAPASDGALSADMGRAYAWIVGATWTAKYKPTSGVLDACVVGGEYRFLRARTGLVVREVSTTHMDPGDWATYVPMKITTSHLHLNGVVGFQRVRAAGIVGDVMSPCNLSLSLTKDYEISPYQTETWTDSELLALPSYPTCDIRVRSSKQRCYSVKITVLDAQPSVGAVGSGAGYTFEGVTLELGVREGATMSVPSQNRK